MVDKVKQAEAFEKLLKIAHDGSIPLYAYQDDYHKGGRDWPVEWEHELIYNHFRTKADRQYALNKVLERLVEVNFPSSVKQMDKERGLSRLVLDAGADPNFYSRSYNDCICDVFLTKRKDYIALEIAKTEDFTHPRNIDSAFEHLADSLKFYTQWGKPYSGDTPEEAALIAQNCSDRKELVYFFFQKGLYPRDEHVFQSLVPIVLEKDPEFFNKKKEQIITRLQRAKTPLQIYNAFMKQEKERE